MTQESIIRAQNKFICKLSWVDLITLLGVFSSCYAIKSALAGQLSLAIAWLFIAAISDAIDGVLARKYNLVSDFGRYLDSFMDVLCYLVAPSMVLFCWGFDGLYGLVLMLLIMCGCIRLAVFNELGNIVDDNGAPAYLGMPVFWISLIVAAAYILAFIVGDMISHFLLATALIASCFAMLYNAPFYKFTSLKFMGMILFGGGGTFLTMHFCGA